MWFELHREFNVISGSWNQFFPPGSSNSWWWQVRAIREINVIYFSLGDVEKKLISSVWDENNMTLEAILLCTILVHQVILKCTCKSMIMVRCTSFGILDSTSWLSQCWMQSFCLEYRSQIWFNIGSLCLFLLLCLSLYLSKCISLSLSVTLCLSHTLFRRRYVLIVCSFKMSVCVCVCVWEIWSV